jgi:tetratricopeptide (TPR) repeat protein
MSAFRFATGLVLLTGMAGPAFADLPGASDPAALAATLFREGKFAEAESLFAKIQASDPKNYDATLGLGRVALFKNDLAIAERWLTMALALKPADKSAKQELALLYYRRDQFAKAAPIYRSLGAEALAKKLESFANETPYLLEGKADVCTVPFVHTDPLPLIQVKVGDQTVYFLIDTGGSEIYIDPELAKRVKATEFGSTTNIYGGGLKAETGQGRIDQVTLGDFVIRNVPVHILNTRRFNAAARGKRVEGILGTVMLSHFLATLDYPGGQLILRRKTDEQLKQLAQQVQSAKGITVPFYLAGDHYMVARGQVNKSKPMLFFADTGLAGGGFTCPKSTLKEATIQLPDQPGVEGVGGGGKIKAVPFLVEELSLGAAKRKSIQAFAGVFPEHLEFAEGFRIGGIISHQFFRPYALSLDFTGMRFFLVSGRTKSGDD